MGREAKAKTERRKKREAARAMPQPHPEDVLAYLRQENLLKRRRLVIGG